VDRFIDVVDWEGTVRLGKGQASLRLAFWSF
jgi:hypothetical protein